MNVPVTQCANCVRLTVSYSNLMFFSLFDFCFSMNTVHRKVVTHNLKMIRKLLSVYLENILK